MKIKEADIKKQQEQSYEQRQERARDLVIKGLSEGNYRGLLEIVIRYELDIPKDRLEGLVNYGHHRCSDWVEQSALICAGYERLGKHEEAKALTERVKQIREERKQYDRDNWAERAAAVYDK